MERVGEYTNEDDSHSIQDTGAPNFAQSSKTRDNAEEEERKLPATSVEARPSVDEDVEVDERKEAGVVAIKQENEEAIKHEEEEKIAIKQEEVESSDDEGKMAIKQEEVDSSDDEF